MLRSRILGKYSYGVAIITYKRRSEAIRGNGQQYAAMSTVKVAWAAMSAMCGNVRQGGNVRQCAAMSTVKRRQMGQRRSRRGWSKGSRNDGECREDLGGGVVDEGMV